MPHRNAVSVGGFVRREAPAHAGAGRSNASPSWTVSSLTGDGAGEGVGVAAADPASDRGRRPRASAPTKRGEAIARVPVNLAAPARPCLTWPLDVLDSPPGSVRCGRGMLVAELAPVAMTHRSYADRYLRWRPPDGTVGATRELGRLGAMRVRRFGLRLIGSALVGAWGLAAALVLLAYRPGGPLDVVVGITMLLPLGIAAAGVGLAAGGAPGGDPRADRRARARRRCSSCCRPSAACSTSCRRSARRP